MLPKIDQLESGDNPYTVCVTYLVGAGSSETAGNNMWARAINWCRPEYEYDPEKPPELACLIVTTRNYEISIRVNIANLNKIPARARKLVILHEAGHLCLLHLTRGARLLLASPLKGQQRDIVEALLQLALDFDVNTHVLRPEPECAWMLANKDRAAKEGWLLLFPEHFGLPMNLSAEEYFLTLYDKLPKLKPILEQVLDPSGKLALKQPKPSWQQDPSENGIDGMSNKGAPTAQGKGAASDQARQPPPLSPDEKENALLLQMLHEILSRTAAHPWLDAPEVGDLSDKEQLELMHQLEKQSKRALRDAKRITDSINKGKNRDRGLSSSSIDALIDALLEDDPYPWHWLLEDLVGGQVGCKQEDSMRQPALELLQSDVYEPWPGRHWDPTFEVAFVRDSSGSVGNPEFARACAVLNRIMRTDRNVKMRVIDVDASILHEVVTDKIEARAQYERHGAGGTVYVPAFKRLLGADEPGDWADPADYEKADREVPPPDLVLVVTDGGVRIEGECFPQWKPLCPVYWLLLPDCKTVPGMSDAPPDRVIEMFEMPDVPVEDE